MVQLISRNSSPTPDLLIKFTLKNLKIYESFDSFRLYFLSYNFCHKIYDNNLYTYMIILYVITNMFKNNDCYFAWRKYFYPHLPIQYSLNTWIGGLSRVGGETEAKGEICASTIRVSPFIGSRVRNSHGFHKTNFRD